MLLRASERRQLTSRSNAAITAEVRVSTPSFMKMFSAGIVIFYGRNMAADHKIGDGKKLGAWLHLRSVGLLPQRKLLPVCFQGYKLTQ